MTAYNFVFTVISLLAQISTSRALQCFNGNVNVKDCQAAQASIPYQQPSLTLGPTGRIETSSVVGGCLILIHRTSEGNVAAQADVDKALNTIYGCSGSSGFTDVQSVGGSTIQVTVVAPPNEPAEGTTCSKQQKVNKEDCKKAQGTIVYQKPSLTLGPTGPLVTIVKAGGCSIKIHRMRYSQAVAAKADVDKALTALFGCPLSAGSARVKSAGHIIRVTVEPV
ncbi:hypothetical protein Pst134EB_026242 [Puccinia striiformis f. sp. tritici]|uniref:Secreted protein n=1 Tax=Puccinia striiformis f. sp. tritici PST-78 TaxID=1165861 RepID=A0A0L0UVN1_9BASI|nr:hypothetical protein Pst134EB_026242 [Puccinia striiformis f. sp. tritici]KNE91103.1 hypothetical protein PSTG_15455 [Puccinia striiformis f. sp. tritici PST-78]